jgi:ACS family hexuronate transporter-like MFS transporter
LERALHVPTSELAGLLWLPPFGWEVGYFFWGWLLDRLLAGGSPPLTLYRRLFALLALLSLPFALAPGMALAPAMALMFFENFIASGFVIGTIRFATWIFTAANAGLIAGLTAGGWGLAVALSMPYFGRLFDTQQWQASFTLCALTPIAGYALWFALSRRAATLLLP